MPRDHITLESGDYRLTIYYKWSRWTEHNGPRDTPNEFFEWDYEELYLNGAEATREEVELAIPNWDALAYARIRARH